MHPSRPRQVTASKVRIACLAALSIVLFTLAAAPRAGASESLPMPVGHYADLCRQSGGGIASHLNGGFGATECQWSGHGRTECKVGADGVRACAIACMSSACLKANPDRYNPTWPLAGGPNSAALPTVPNADTLAPSN
ncbi:MAG: hypothetical protein ACREEP_11810 [Dongiaceae bacterium]